MGSEMCIRDSIRMGDIKIKNIEVLGAKSIPIVTVISPRALKAIADAAAAADAAAKTAAPVAAVAAAPEAAKEEKKD